MVDDESRPSLYRVMVERCSELEASHAKLNQQLNELALEKQQERPDGKEGTTSFSGDFTDPETGLLPRYFKAGQGRSPYEHVLQSIGHAVHVTAAASGEITYWNRSAERLYGWKDYEVMGRKDLDFLIDKEYAPTIKKIKESLHSGQSWSGQFPFKRRSGGVFMAIVTKSPLYEDDELVGFITVSSDAAMFNDPYPNSRISEGNGNEGPKVTVQNPRRTQWHQLPPIKSVPQIASSVSSLASKVVSKKHGDDIDSIGSASMERVESASESEDANLKNPKAAVAKIWSKLNIRKNNQNFKEKAWNSFQNGTFSTSTSNQVTEQPRSSGVSLQVPLNNCCNDAQSPSLVATGQHPTLHRQRISTDLGKASCSCCRTLTKDCNESSKDCTMGISSPTSCVEPKELEHELGNRKSLEPEGDDEQLPVIKQHPISGGSVDSSHESSSSKGDHESSSVDSGIQWDELQLGEEVGQGSFAVVYRGLWNGSDVAIKVFLGNEYNEGTLLGYKKEIDIMRRLRHPNVLLFMGACYSHERLAIVTEFLPRGSLFKTLHRSNQVLDIKRRLRMALDVTRGMNYLHRRNPPIIHRDLKSSNLLVDKNWTVKVGDFGLSRLKHATLVSAKSGLGTPQWMAPEILRNEPSNEKSDVFSFGVILWELMTVSIPWNNLNPLQVVGVVGFMDRRLDMPEGLDPRIASIITDCWQSKPERRPSFQDIIHRMTGLLRSAQ